MAIRTLCWPGLRFNVTGAFPTGELSTYTSAPAGSDANVMAPRFAGVRVPSVFWAGGLDGAGVCAAAASVCGAVAMAASGADCLPSGSSSAEMFTLPLVTLIFLSQILYPLFITLIVWSPGETPMAEGVLPIKLPSNSMSALLGVDAISINPSELDGDGLSGFTYEADCATGELAGETGDQVCRALCGAESIVWHASLTEFPSSRVESLKITSPSRLNTAILLRRC